MSRVTIAIFFHSGYGHTARQAQAVALGVSEVEHAEALLMTVEEATTRWGELAVASAVIFGCPTYMGGPSAAFKTFQEATSKSVLGAGFIWKDKLAAGFTNSGGQAGDKLATLIQLALFAAQHGMHWINLDLAPGNNSSAGSNADLNRLGIWLGAGAQSNVDEGPETAPPASDLATARHLGRRVARVALELTTGRALLATE